MSCDVRHALDTACEFDSGLIELFTESVFSGTLEQEDKDTIKDVMLRQAHHIKLLANLAVAQSHLPIDTVRTILVSTILFRIFKRNYRSKHSHVYRQLSCKITEIVPFGDIGDIYNVSTGRDAHEFIIRRNRNGGTLYFSSPERNQMIKVRIFFSRHLCNRIKTFVSLRRRYDLQRVG